MNKSVFLGYYWAHKTKLRDLLIASKFSANKECCLISKALAKFHVASTNSALPFRIFLLPARRKQFLLRQLTSKKLFAKH